MDNDRNTRIEDKIDKLVEKIGSIDVTLAAQHESLKDHIRRTELLEQKMEPVEHHVALMDVSLKIFGALAAVVTVMASFFELLGYFKK